MLAKTSMIVLVLASFQVALSYGYAAHDESAKRICDAPALAGEGKDRLRMTGVSQPENFLSQSVKDVPAVCMGDGLVYRYEVEEPSDDDEVMNAAREKIGETSPEAVEAAKEKLVELLKKDTKLDVPLDNSEWLVRFLRLRDYDVQAAYKLIKNYYNFRAQNKKLFDGLNATSESDIIETNVLSVLPKRDEDGSRIAVIQCKNWDSDRFSLVDVLKMGVVLGELGSYEPATQIAGVKLIIDMEGTTMKQLKKVTPSMMKKLMEYSLNSAPYKNVGVHFVNENNIFQTIYKMMKPFITSELKSKMFFHQKNLDSLHRHIPASLLPEVYGGSYPMPTFTPAEWNSLLTAFDPEFQKINTYGVKKN